MSVTRPAHHFCSLCRARRGSGAAASPGRSLEAEMSPDASYTERCPWCDNLVTRAKFLEIQERIRQEERKRLAAPEAALRQRFDQEFRQKIETEKKSLERRLKDEAEKKVTPLIAERDQAKAKLKEIEAREGVMLKTAKEEAEQKVKSIQEEAER